MVLFVGDRPSSRTDPHIAFKNAGCEKRLMKWLEIVGMKEGDYKLVNSTDSLFHTYAVMAAHSGVPIVALGNAASKALKDQYFPHYKLPHPSGRNLQVNDHTFIAKKLNECKNWLKSKGVL